MLLPLFWALQLSSADTLKIGSLGHPPALGEAIDSAHLGPPQVRLRTGQGTAEIWLLRAADTFFVAASIPDSTPYWGDDFVLSLDTRGEGAPSPQHDDFQFDFRRVLDSSVVFRGRKGRWEPPRDDPDWRIGSERSGGGWEVRAWDGRGGWSLLLRLDPAWIAGENGRLPRLAFRIYDDAPPGWYAWPLAQEPAPPTTVERTPSLWSVAK
jgi:hypothetical protein